MISSDIVRMYREIHSWVGIVCGLFLFIAFYAGAISMFEVPLQRWTSPPIDTQLATPLTKTQELINKASAKYPGAAKNFTIVLDLGPDQPARMQWQQRPAGADEHDPAINYYADLDNNGELNVRQDLISPAAQIIDDIHQQVGLLIEHEQAMVITGLVSLLYGLALVSGVIILLPTLVKDLFALRLGKKIKRLWLDVHNLLGVFSLPFHIVMAFTSLTFAYHDYFYDSQMASIYPDKKPAIAGPAAVQASSPAQPLYPVAAVLAKLKKIDPEFGPEQLNYRRGRGPNAGLTLLVAGNNPKHHANRARFGYASVDPYTGELIDADYMPGHQSPMMATVGGFFSLHFGSFGGNATRWLYFILGLGGSFLFYSGNLLWIEAKRKKSRTDSNGKPTQQSRSSKILGSLTIGISLGCIAGISLVIASAKLIPALINTLPGSFSTLYYLVFFAALCWALYRGAARSAVELLYTTAACTALIPIASLLALLFGLGWNHGDSTVWVDIVAMVGALCFLKLAAKTTARIRSAPQLSVWSAAS